MFKQVVLPAKNLVYGYGLEANITWERVKMDVEDEGMEDTDDHINNTALDGLKKPLFGGSLQCVLPLDAVDISLVREVPDHQEVFCHKTTDQSIMIDILQYQAEHLGEQAPRYHFHDIAEANAAESKNEVVNIECIPKHQIAMQECHEAWFLTGTQLVSKFNEESCAQNEVKIYMGLFRIPQFETDIVITMNDPLNISATSSSNKDSTSSSNQQSNPWTADTFKTLLSTLKILDQSLFA